MKRGSAEACARGPDIDKARELLAESRLPERRRDCPHWSSTRAARAAARSSPSCCVGKLREIGVRLNVRMMDFSQLMSALDNKKGQLFGYAWSSDYPDAENNLSLFYGPNESPGNNSFNYKNPEYDALYRQILTMEPSPERTAIYERMRDISCCTTRRSWARWPASASI